MPEDNDEIEFVMPANERRVNLDEVYRLLHDHEQNGNGKIFWVRFARKNPRKLRPGRESVTEEKPVREMLCRFGVKSYLKGGPDAYDPAKYALMFVFDVQEKDYRSISLDNVLELALNKLHYIVI